jgi:hypothetical protein
VLVTISAGLLVCGTDLGDLFLEAASGIQKALRQLCHQIGSYFFRYTLSPGWLLWATA